MRADSSSPPSLTRLFFVAALAHGEVRAKRIGVETRLSKKTILSHHRLLQGCH